MMYSTKFLPFRRKYDLDVQISASGCTKNQTSEDDGDNENDEFEKVCRSMLWDWYAAYWQAALSFYDFLEAFSN